MSLYQIFLILLVLSTIIALRLTFYALRRREVPGALPFALILSGAWIWAGGYAFELTGSSLESKIFWDNVQFLGTDAFTAGALLFALAYTGRPRAIRRFGWLVGVAPLVGLVLIWMDPFYGLVRGAPNLGTATPFPILVYEFGPWVWFVAIYGYLMLLVSLGLLVIHAVRTGRPTWAQNSAILIGLAAPAGGTMLTIFGLVPIQEMEHLDIAPVTLALATPILAWGVFRHHLLDVQERQHLQEELFRLAFDQSPIGAAIVGLDYRFLRVNEVLCQMTGYTAAELIGQSFQAITHPDDVEHDVGQVRRLVAGEITHYSMEKRYIRKDGRIAWVNLSVRLVCTSSGQPLHFLSMIEDITERKQAGEALRQARDELASVLVIAEELVSTLDLEPLLDRILEQLARIITYENAAILTLSQETLEFCAYRGRPRLPTIVATHVPVSDVAVLQTMLATRQPFVVADLRDDPASLRLLERLRGEPTDKRAWLGVPLTFGDEVIGMLSLTHTRPGFYTTADMQRLQALANPVAIAIKNAQLYQQARQLAAAEERARLARDLHDSVTQALYSINLCVNAASMALDAGKLVVAREHMDALRAFAGEAMLDMRLLIFELQPPILEQEGLVAALRARLQAVEARSGIAVKFTTSGHIDLAPEAQTELYRMSQEILTNVVKHAHARQVTVRLDGTEEHVRLQIQDNGVGFDRVHATTNGKLGLRSLQERAARIHGRVHIDSRPGVGTTVRVELDRGVVMSE